ncbi:MAG: coenzyme F420-0:L-glutamate ligase, partial [Candidatus Bathyarchaeota archaeon]
MVARRYRTIAVATGYWRPREDYLNQIVDSLEGRIQDGDIVTISEKAISTALGNLVDESTIDTSRLAKHLAKYWMRFGWGYILGPLSRLRNITIQHIRSYPL